MPSLLKCNATLESDSDFALLGARAGVSASAIAEWVADAVWLEVAVDPIPVFLSSFDRCIDRSSKWTRELSDAHRFNPSTVLSDGTLRVIQRHGLLVPVSCALTAAVTSLPRRAIRWVDHNIEAHASWSLWMLSLRFGFADVAARQQALKHAAMARWETASSGCCVGGRQFSDCVELRQAYDMGCVLHRAVDFLTTNMRGRTNGSDGECSLAS